MSLLLWSGGCDSTLLLHDMLTAKHDQTGNRLGKFVTLKPNEPIRVLSINHPQVVGYEMCQKARKALTQKLIRFGKFEHHEVTITQKSLLGNGYYGLDTNGGIPQSAIWLLHAALHLRSNEDLYAGYIRSDDMWHYKEQVYGAFGCLQALTGKTGRLLCPLEYQRKRDVLCELKTLKLLKHTWHCESHEKKPCGKCASCETHELGLFSMNRLLSVGTESKTD